MKRTVRIACLLGILFTALQLKGKVANASDAYCDYYCSGERYIAWCYTDIAVCCRFIRHACPAPLVFEGGSCTSGENFCDA